MTVATIARHRLGARAPRHPHRHHRASPCCAAAIYLILATNLGARLGFLVALAGLAGWMVLMGVDLVDLRHRPARAPSRRGRRCPAARCCRTRSALYQAGVLDEPLEIPDGRLVRRARPTLVAAAVRRRGLERRSTSPTPAFGQAGAAAGVFLEETGAFEAGEFQVVNVFDIGGERYPKIGETLDFLAFCHEPHYVARRGRPARADARPSPAGRRRPPRSTRPASTSTSTWSATSAPVASRRSC